MSQEKRVNFWDNYKALLIILVVFGHIIEYYSMSGAAGIMRALIYSFHMPAFIFISGFFSKNVSKNSMYAFEKTLLPFFIFNTIWLIMMTHTWKVDIFLPTYVFWYLFSLFIWRITAHNISRIRFAVFWLIIISLYIGCFHDADRFFSISRTLVYFPYFMLGYQMSPENVNKVRKVPHWITGGIIIICLSLTGILNHYHLIPIKTYENLQCYHCSKIGNLQGIEIRFLQTVIAFLIVLSLLNLMTDKKYIFTSIGQKTLTIYLLSPFITQGIKKICDIISMTSRLSEDIFFLLVFSIFTTIGIVWFCSRKTVCLLYDKTFTTLSNLLFKKIYQ